MIGEKFEFNNKSYTIKKDVSFGEYRKISKLGNSLQNITKEYELADDVKKDELLKEFTKTTDEQLETISDFIETTLGLKQSEIEKMSLFDAISLFQKAFTVSTEVKKKPETTLDLPSS